MTDEELAAIRARCEAATPGPWIDLAAAYSARMDAYKERTGRWWHGSRAASLPVTLIVQARHRGEPLDIETIPTELDYYDLKKVIALRWSALRGRTTVATEGFFMPADAAFITHAREDIPALLAEIDRLRAGAGAG